MGFGKCTDVATQTTQLWKWNHRSRPQVESQSNAITDGTKPAANGGPELVNWPRSHQKYTNPERLPLTDIRVASSHSPAVSHTLSPLVSGLVCPHRSSVSLRPLQDLSVELNTTQYSLHLSFKSTPQQGLALPFKAPVFGDRPESCFSDVEPEQPRPALPGFAHRGVIE